MKLLKQIATIHLAKKLSKKHTKYSNLFDRSLSLDEKKIVAFFVNVTRKYYPEYKELVADANNNPFSVVFNLYFEGKISREDIPQNLENSPELLKVFCNCESVVAQLGQNPSTPDEVISSFAHGVFFGKVSKIKMFGLPLRKKVLFYNQLFCKDWVKHVAWIYSFKRYSSIE